MSESPSLAPLLVALNKVMAGSAAVIEKNRRNEFHKYDYADEAAVLAIVRPLLVEHGILLLPSLGEPVPEIDEHGNTHLIVEYELAHVSGAVWPTKLRIPGCGNDRNSKGGVGDKGTYKALTGANKYLLFKLLQLATGEDPEATDEGKPTDGSKPAPAGGASKGTGATDPFADGGARRSAPESKPSTASEPSAAGPAPKPGVAPEDQRVPKERQDHVRSKVRAAAGERAKALNIEPQVIYDALKKALAVEHALDAHLDNFKQVGKTPAWAYRFITSFVPLAGEPGGPSDDIPF